MADDPYPVYRELRHEHPVYHNPERDFWALSRFSDVQDAARDWRRFSSSGGVDIDVAADFFGAGDFISFEPPKHTRLRGVVKEAFSMRGVAALEEGICARVDELLDDVLELDTCDFVGQVAARLPLGVIFGVLGFPGGDGDELMPLMHDVLERTPGASDVPDRAIGALRGLESYIDEIAARRRRHPEDDVLSAIVEAERAGDVLPGEATGICLLLLLAGWETTSVLAANAIWLLARYPEQRGLLIDQPDRIPAAIEEMLRFESPAQQHMRIAVQDVELHGVTIPAGDRVVLLWASANRDETRWQDADRFDVVRSPQRNLAFGEGIHHCLGAPLARLEGRVVVERVLARAPDYEVGEPERFPGVVIRGFTRLPVRWR
jgi:cytochrome P450